MGYIKKLKSNELVGGTDKTTIYPVTSTEAVFEEITNGNESSFKSQKTINGEHDGRIKGLENEMPDTVKSITINGGQRVNRVDENGNVDLTIYSDGGQDYEGLTEIVADLRDIVGENPEEPQSGTLLERVDGLEENVGTGGTVDSRIATTKAELEEQIAGKQKTLSVGAGITLTSDGVISATADPSVAKVVEELPTGNDIVDGLIYLKKTNTAGTYSQHVHSTNGWSDNLPSISLGITTDDAIDSTSTNPIQNDAITAQIGYFVCGDSNGSSATKNVDAPSYSPSDVGGAFKIKMNYANTSTDTVYLRFNSDDTTEKELRYNGEPVTPTNTWGSPEVISVYYDGTYYQASNAQGGGKMYDTLGWNNDRAMTQKAVTEELTIAEDTSYGSLYTGRIIVAAGTWSASSNSHSFYYKKVEPGETYYIGRNETQYVIYAWLVTVNVNAAPDFAPSHNERLGISPQSIVQEPVYLTVPEDAEYLYIQRTNAGTDTMPTAFKKINYVKDVVNEHSEDLDTISEELIDFTSYASEVKLSNYSAVPFCIKVSDNQWTATSSGRNHKVIPLSDFLYFKITAGSTNPAYYTWLIDDVKDGNTPHYAQGVSGLYSVPVNQTVTTDLAPENANYLYLTISNDGDFTPSAVYGYSNVASGMEGHEARIKALEGNSELTNTYIGGKIDLKEYHYSITKWFNLSILHQSGACWGNYYFMVAEKFAKIDVVDLTTKAVVYTWTKPEGTFVSSIYHCNQCTFGTIFYDENDEFPLLYVTANNDSEGRCSQIVFRVTRNENVFDFTHVQTIYLPIMTSENCLGNANMAIDRVRKRMVFYSRDNNGSTGWCKISEMNIPSFVPVEGDEVQEVTLNDGNILHSYFINSSAILNQGAVIYAGKLFIGRGRPDDSVIELTVVDLMNKCQIATIDLYADGFNQEPEGVFIYNGAVCMSTLRNAFYYFTFE